VSIENVVSPACFKAVSATTPAPQTTTSTDFGFPDGLRVHNAWHITWASSDRAALSPTPPLLTCTGGQIQTWVPGQPVDHYDCPDSPKDGIKISQGAIYFLAIGLPIIVVVLVAACCTCCFWRRCKERRARKVAAHRG